MTNGQSYPPYNIERTGENAYRITLAVAGFAESELTVETRENTLTVRGAKETVEKGDSEKREVLYQGIAARAFERRFHLADHVSATKATCENGLLHIDLVREVPEAQKPRTISIQTVGQDDRSRAGQAGRVSRPRPVGPRRAPARGRLFLSVAGLSSAAAPSVQRRHRQVVHRLRLRLFRQRRASPPPRAWRHPA